MTILLTHACICYLLCSCSMRSQVRQASLAVQGVVSTLLGFFLLGGVEFHAINVLGIVINAIGGTW